MLIHSSFARRWALIGLIVLLPGCFNSDKEVVTGTVSGQVLLDGKPIPTGCLVVFIPNSSGADTGSGLIQAEGKYNAVSGDHNGIPVGEYQVVIQPPAMEEKAKAELEKKNSVTILTAMMNRDKKALKKVENPLADIIPMKYWANTTSGLIFTVNKGDNVANFELKAEKQKK